MGYFDRVKLIVLNDSDRNAFRKLPFDEPDPAYRVVSHIDKMPFPDLLYGALFSGPLISHVIKTVYKNTPAWFVLQPYDVP